MTAPKHKFDKSKTLLPGMRRPMGRGSSKTGGSGGGGVQQPNSLRSVSYVTCLDLISEGPIQGLHNGLQSVFFNGTVFQNPDTTFNFDSTAVVVGLGYPNQPALPGFSNVTSSQSVGLEVLHGQPITLAVNDLNADAVRVTLEVTALWQEDNQGNVNPWNVAYEVAVRQIDGPWQPMSSTLTGKCTSPYYWDVVLGLPGVGPWEVQVTRLSQDDPNLQLNSVIYWAAMTVIESRTFAYPDSAIIGVQTNGAVFSGSVPTRTYEIDGLLINIPSNYNPTSRTYTGVWDGTFVTAFSNNPVWVLYNLITNTRWGIGKYIGNFLPDKWKFYNAAVWCDGIVPDGFGGTQPRFTFNGSVPAQFGSKDQAIKVLQDVAASFWGQVYWFGGTIGLMIDMPTDPVGPVFSRANVIEGRFTYSGTALKARHLQALISWWDPAQRYQAQTEVVQNLTVSAWNAISKQLIGCTNRGQAHRYGKWILDTEANATQTVVFQAGWDCVGILPGDVVLVADPFYAGKRFAGRLTAVAASGSPLAVTSVTMDAPYDFMLGQSYMLQAQLPDGTTQIVPVANAPGISSVVNLGATTFTSAPLVGTTFAIIGDVVPKPFRVLGIKESAPNIFELTGLEYDSTKWARIEQNITLAPPKYTLYGYGPPAAPTALSVKESVYDLNGSTFNRVTLSWTPSTSASIEFYETQYLDLNGVWVAGGETSGTSVDIDDFTPGNYSFQVRVWNSAGQSSGWVQLNNVSVVNLLTPPPDVQNVSVSVTGQQSTISWDPVGGPNIGWYRIKWTPATTNTDWGSASLIADNITSTNFNIATLGGTFLVKAVSTQGIESVDPTPGVAPVSTANVANIVALFEEDPGFYGAVQQVTAGNSELTLQFSEASGYVPVGTYYFANQLDLGDVYTARLTSLVSAFGQRTSDVMSTWVTLASVVDLAGSDASQWSAQVEYRVAQSAWDTAYKLNAGAALITFGADYTQEGTNNYYIINPTRYASNAAYMTGQGQTFTRSGSIGSIYNASGFVVSTAANIPRFDYNPLSGMITGLLMEGSSTNLLLQSAFAASWSTTGVTLTAASVLGPDDTSSGAQFREDTSTGDHLIHQTVTTTAFDTYSYSVYLKKGTRQFAYLTYSSADKVYFDLGEGKISANASGYTASIEKLPDGWYRCTVILPVPNNTGVFSVGMSQTGLAGSDSYTGDGASTIFAWGAQVELALYQTSYIPTTTTTITRSRDSLTRSRTLPTTMTKLITGVTPVGAPSTEAVIWEMNDGTTNNLIKFTYTSSQHLEVVVVSGGTTTTLLDLGSFPASTQFTICAKLAANAYAASLNGAPVVTSSSGAFPTAITTDVLGGPSGTEWNSWIQQDIEWSSYGASSTELVDIAGGNFGTYWSDWDALVVSYVTFWRAQFRLVLNSTDAQVTPVVSELSVTGDMDTQSQGNNNLSAPSGGITVVFPYAFKVLSSLTLTAFNTSAGDHFVYTSKTNAGFAGGWQDISGNPVARLFDWNALGYGKVG